MKRIIQVLFFLSMSCYAYGQMIMSVDGVTTNIEIKKLLPEGKIPFEVLDSMEITERQTELSYKIQKTYQEDVDTFNTYFEKKRNNQKAKYPKNSILSEKEFLEYMDFLNNGIKLLPSRIEIIEVTIVRLKKI